MTELSWPAALGKLEPDGFETTEKGQAKRLRTGLVLLAAARRKLRIGRVYWYTWLSLEGTDNSFGYSGLRRLRDGAVVSAPSLAAFRQTARGSSAEQRVDRARGGVPGEPGGAREAGRAQPLPLRVVAQQRVQRGRERLASGSASTAAPPQVSGSAPAAAATTGVPAAIASSTGSPKPS